MTRWVSLNDLAAETGLAVRSLQYIRAQEPGVLPTRMKGKVMQYEQPACAVNLRKRDYEAGRKDEREKYAKKNGEEGSGDPMRRKLVADARKAEIEVELLERSVVRVDEAVEEVSRVFEDLRNGLIPFPRTAAPKAIAAKTIIEMEQILEAEVHRLMDILSTPPTFDEPELEAA